MQPPPGYSEPPQQPQPGSQPPQPGAQPLQYGVPPGYGVPPYAMQQYPYYAPPKKGMPGWAWVLIVLGVLLVLFLVLGIFALAAIPLVTSNTRDARRAEGEELLNQARDAARVQYSKTGRNPVSFASFTMPGTFSGDYYSVDDSILETKVQAPPTSSRGEYELLSVSATITATPNSRSDGRGRMEFDWASGDSKVTWDR